MFWVRVYVLGDKPLRNSKQYQVWLVAARHQDENRGAIGNETFDLMSTLSMISVRQTHNLNVILWQAIIDLEDSNQFIEIILIMMTVQTVPGQLQHIPEP